MGKRFLRYAAFVFFCCIQQEPDPVDAATYIWIGGNADWVDGAANNANWNPATEPGPTDEAFFVTNNDVNVGSANSVQSLRMQGFIHLNTNNNALTVDGLAQLVNDDTTLIVGGSAGSLAADSLTINGGSLVDLQGGSITIDEESGNGLLFVNEAGSLIGHGTITFNDDVAPATYVLVNDGEIAVGPRPTLFAPPAGTLTINAADSDARVDLDGATGNGVVTVRRNQTLDLNIPPLTAFSGDINLFQNSTLDFPAAGWVIGSGTMDVDNGAIVGIPPVPAGVATIRGGALTLDGGTITVLDIDGILQFDSHFLHSDGDLVNNGHVIFNNSATIGAGANFTMPTISSRITVGSNSFVAIDQRNFDVDGPGAATNVLTINSGGTLVLDLGIGGDESIGGTINLNGGTLDVATLDDDWSMVGALNVAAGPDSTLISSDLHGKLVFEPTNNTTLIGNLRLDNFTTVVQSGAAFGGTGKLVNLADRTLAPAHLSTINAAVENGGIYANSGSGIGRNDMLTFVQTAIGNFVVDLQGTSTSQHDRLRADGGVQLAGALTIDLGGSYVPVPGDLLDILASTAGITGTFAVIFQPVDMPAGLLFRVLYQSTLVQLLAQLPGDFNNNGTVDAADYVLWRNTFGQTVPSYTGADGDGDGMVDNDDYNLWRSKFGTIVGSGAALGQSSAEVPEPDSLPFAFAVLLTLLICRRRHW